MHSVSQALRVLVLQACNRQPGTRLAVHSVLCITRCLASKPAIEGDGIPQPGSPELSSAPSSSAEEPLGWLQGPGRHRKQHQQQTDEWVEQEDPSSGRTCWRSRKTGEVTVPGTSKPDTWSEVVDKRSGLLYYWNQRTGDTTTLGEAKPGPYGRRVTSSLDGIGRGGLSSSLGAATSAASAQQQQSASKQGQGEKGGAGGGKEPEPSIVGLYNNPLGWFLLSIATVGIVKEVFFKDS